MAQQKLTILPEVRKHLRQALVYEEDLWTLVKTAPREPLNEPAGAFLVKASLPVPRLMDPETAEMRVLEVQVRPSDGGWEIFEVLGLDGSS